MGKFNNNNNKRSGGNYNNNNRQGGGAPRRSKEEYEAIKAAQIAQQTKNLEVIEAIAKLLNDWMDGDNCPSHFSMKDILSELNKTYSVDETKAVSQYSYMLMELANARKNKYVSGDRINIRIMYIEERMKTSFKKELHDKAVAIIDGYPTLFKWDTEAEGKDYDVLGTPDKQA